MLLPPTRPSRTSLDALQKMSEYLQRR